MPIDTIPHHTVIIVGGGPAGLGFAPVFGGWHPFLRPRFRSQGPLDNLLTGLHLPDQTLLTLDFTRLAHLQIPPAHLFRALHHPSPWYRSPEDIGLVFRPGGACLDYLLLTQEAVGGLWNTVPDRMLTLSPGHWMELAFYPLAQHVHERNIACDVNALIDKQRLLDYYQAIPDRFGQAHHIRTSEKVTRIEPHPKGFLLTSVPLPAGPARYYTCKYLIYAAGQRCIPRTLNVPGEFLPLVHHHYERADDVPGRRILVVGGGRSGDFAAMDLYDAGREILYVMRQARDNHWRLIGDSLNLPYYAHLADILQNGTDRFECFYRARLQLIEAGPRGALVTLDHDGAARQLHADSVVIEIGGEVDYSIFHGFPRLQLVPKYDRYRRQLDQVVVRPHNYESVDVPNLYPGGYLAADLDLVVIGMHGSTYPIAADILKKEGVTSQ